MSKDCKVCGRSFEGTLLRCEPCLAKQRERSSKYKKSPRGRATAAAYLASESGRRASREWQKAYVDRVGKEEMRRRAREKARRAYRKNPEKFRERSREYAKRNPIKRREISARRRARRTGSTALPIAAADLALKLEMFGHKCWICLDRPWEVWDHVKPLSRGGAHMLANLRPACARCNNRKYNTWPFGRAEREIISSDEDI